MNEALRKDCEDVIKAMAISLSGADVCDLHIADICSCTLAKGSRSYCYVAGSLHDAVTGCIEKWKAEMV